MTSYHVSPDQVVRICRATPPESCRYGTAYPSEGAAAFSAQEHTPLSAAEQVLSKQIAYLLRHKPETGNLTVDEAGNVDTQALLTATSSDIGTLRRVVYMDSKQRYVFSDNEQRIRAAQGHSFPVKLPAERVPPPATLYHGTKEAFWSAISTQGLQPMKRQYVHLSAGLDTANQVASRRQGDSIMLSIDTAAAQQAGVEFLRASNGVWLASAVPASCINRD